jgi:hypothetical protein
MSARSAFCFGQFSRKGFALPVFFLVFGIVVSGSVLSADLAPSSEDAAAPRRLSPECDPDGKGARPPNCLAPVVNSSTSPNVPSLSGGKSGEAIGKAEEEAPHYTPPGPVAIPSGPSTLPGPAGGFSGIVQQGTGNAAAPVTIRASRLFSGPAQFPPEDFRAYGVVAFPSRATSHDRDRHLMICEAYVAALPHADDLSIQPRANQMVTVWPVDNLDTAKQLNGGATGNVCPQAVDAYSLVSAQQAIHEARQTGLDLSARGPFLLAWSPSNSKGTEDALVLVADLSDVDTPERSLEIMRRWTTDIEKDPKLWDDGWDLELLRVKLRDWVDDIGPKILGTVGF